MTREKLFEFVRKEHQRFVDDVRSLKDPSDSPLSHVYIFDRRDKMDVYALALAADPKLAEFQRNLRANFWWKIHMEGLAALVFCGVVFRTPLVSEDQTRRLEERSKTDASYLETIAAENGTSLTECVVATGESPYGVIQIAQEYRIKGKRAIFDEREESIDKPLPVGIPFCNFQWPKPVH